MSRVAAFGRFWWDFIVGDDPRAAAGVVVAIGITAAIAATGARGVVVPPAGDRGRTRAVAAARYPVMRRAPS